MKRRMWKEEGITKEKKRASKERKGFVVLHLHLQQYYRYY